jgi:hypothetical protein
MAKKFYSLGVSSTHRGHNAVVACLPFHHAITEQSKIILTGVRLSVVKSDTDEHGVSLKRKRGD